MVELARFRVRPERVDDLLTAYGRMLHEFQGDRAGFIDGHLVRLPQHEWLDIILWRSSQDFAASRAKGPTLPGMKAFVDAIDSFVSIEEGSLADIGSCGAWKGSAQGAAVATGGDTSVRPSQLKPGEPQRPAP